MKSRTLFLLIITFSLVHCIFPQGKKYISDHYNKQEYSIGMRDGIELFTSVYTPKDTSQQYPIILLRTPYSVYPYGEEKFPEDFGVPEEMVKDGYIFVFQDVRGRFMSEGKYINMRPYIPDKTSGNVVDESSDTYDTIDWLVKNIKHNNGRVGLWGISYPGFYAAMGAIDAHPALVAVSPEAPIADWYMGDDMHHNGAFSLLMNFNFFSDFGQKRDTLTTEWPKPMSYKSPDAYNFYLDLGPLSNVNKYYFHDTIAFWDSVIIHPNYDYYWKAKNNLPHFNNIRPAVLIVGGWYDAEDLYGPLHIYKSVKERHPVANEYFVMGPWSHGGWIWSNGDSLGDMSFGSMTSDFFQKEMFEPFFEHYLKGTNNFNRPEVSVFETGTNVWKSYQSWPPASAKDEQIYFQNDQKLAFTEPADKSNDFDEYLSDPMKPVPYTDVALDSKIFYNRSFMIQDQRFASERPDVLVYNSEPLMNNVTIAGPMKAELYVSTSGTDADWVVKIIDEFPDDAPDPDPNPKKIEMGGYQQLVRAEIMRGKFRKSFEIPEPFEPDKVEKVQFNLQDINHTFLKGHRIMIQVQSSWFPFFDRNPQTFVKNIFEAEPEDFRKAFIRLYHSAEYPSSLYVKVIKEGQQ